MTMATESLQPQDSRGSGIKGAVLCKQSEIEEDEQDTSPGSDQSDATITAGDKDVQGQGDNAPEIVQSDVSISEEPSLSTIQNGTQKLKQLKRSGKAFEESPSPDPHMLTPESGSNGLTSLNHSQSSSRERLHKCGSQGSEAGSSCLSRDSSFESPYKDSTGINLEDFIHKTINKSPKDRNMLLKLETDLINFINEPKHHYLKFPQMSSYDRMLVHRIAAYFGLDHNVDQTGKCVIVNKTSNKRIPDFSFKEHIDNLDSVPKVKSIIQRENKSLDDRDIYPRNLDKPSLAHTKARSFEERRKRYEKVRSKIFNSCDADPSQEPMAFTEDEMKNGIPNMMYIGKKPVRPSSISRSSEGHPWSSTDSSGYGTDCSSRSKGIPKANSFGGLPHSQHIKTSNKSQSLCKADSLNSGTASPGLQRHFATPPGSRSGSSPLSCSSSTGPVQSPIHQGFLPGQGQNQALWVASDYRNIPPGAIIINPQTGQPYSNPDGSVYTYNPNLPLPNGQPPTSMFQTQEAWTQSSVNDGMNGTELCKHLSAMNLSQQSSLDSVGEPPGPQPSIQFIVGGQNQVPSVNLPQQSYPMAQPPFYQGPQNINGQPAVRYVYPVNCQNQCQHQMSGDMQNQTFPPSSTQGFGNQYGASYNSYPVMASQAMESFVNYSQTTYPVGQGENNVTYSSYPVQYSSGQQPQPQQVFYPSTPNIQQGMTNYTFGTNQGHYQTSPPSQQTLPSANGHLQTVPQGSGVIPIPGNLPTPTSSQFVYPQIPQFQGQPRVASPQIVQYQNVPSQPGLNPTGNPTQPFPILRGLQMNMQIPQIPGVVSQTQSVPPGGPVTVSAKGCTFENTLPKKDFDKQEYVLGGIGSLGSPLVTGPRPLGQILRPPTQTDLQLIGQPSIRPQIPLQPVLHQQKPRMSNQPSSKPQKLRKVGSKEGSESCSSPQNVECESPSVEFLEVHGISSDLSREEITEMLSDLTSLGVQIEVHNEESETRTILALLPSNLAAADLIQTHNNGNYQLRLCNSDI
ncbi:cAMP-regulated phosphoprotein 21-like isoform X1 [Saccostrea echinata]|uniref:cAMP-regulated phosphoprotein 21-like isoform X1 n=1 Tax=Saccostrea echinata TaxID=191078 RepID=UPI002A80941F|nr:cAMP-regulated phosphoprotein 21-like isoform X1 [Saccostrea echinata]XP_061177952.1 cAMP-regulated phosphoprotein 21-like isoform X1 [Saccostrea echinata]